MNLVKTGEFIKSLRNEKGLTQEQLSEQFSVSRRTVSRWETGTNTPDLDILIEMADYFNVDLRELLDGERINRKMDKELKDTVKKVADYSNNEKKKITTMARVYFIIGIIALVTNIILTVSDLPETFWIGFAEGSTIGLALAAMIIGLIYTSGHLAKLIALKKSLFGRE
jgi:transcriptional regulator with XRE-family HTH domain